jgi:hypothetical protein
MKRIKQIKWKIDHQYEEDTLFGHNLAHGRRLTVLRRRTGFGHMDTETGFRDRKDRFWLASGSFDIRNHPDLTVKEAIKLIKKNANNMTGESNRWGKKRGLVYD